MDLVLEDPKFCLPVASTEHIRVFRPLQIAIRDFPTTAEGIARLIKELDQLKPSTKSTILEEMKKKGMCTP